MSIPLSKCPNCWSNQIVNNDWELDDANEDGEVWQTVVCFDILYQAQQFFIYKKPFMMIICIVKMLMQ